MKKQEIEMDQVTKWKEKKEKESLSLSNDLELQSKRSKLIK
jgi:hypothetical protein